MLDTVGGATSMILSARRARSAGLAESDVDANTMRTCAGSRCRKSSLTKGPSVAALSPISCSILRNNCDGFLSPNSSAVRSCCKRRRSETAVRWTSCSRRESYGCVAGGWSMRSRTSVANSGASDATTYSNFVLCCVIPLVANCASTWANHRSGSLGQNGGSLRLTAAMRAGSPVASALAASAVSLVAAGSRDMVVRVSLSCSARRGHQCAYRTKIS